MKKTVICALLSFGLFNFVFPVSNNLEAQLFIEQNKINQANLSYAAVQAPLAYIGFFISPHDLQHPDSDRAVACIDLKTGQPKSILLGAGIEHLHLDTLSNILWCLNRRRSSFDAVDLESFQLVERIEVDSTISGLGREGSWIPQVLYDDFEKTAYVNLYGALVKVNLRTGEAERLDIFNGVLWIDLHAEKKILYLVLPVDHKKEIELIRYDLATGQSESLIRFTFKIDLFKISRAGRVLAAGFEPLPWSPSPPHSDKWLFSAEYWSLKPEPGRLDSSGTMIESPLYPSIRYEFIPFDQKFISFYIGTDQKQYLWQLDRREAPNLIIYAFDFSLGPTAVYVDAQGRQMLLLTPCANTLMSINLSSGQVAMPMTNPLTGQAVTGPGSPNIDIDIRGLAVRFGQKVAGDLTGDGKRDISDLVEILRLLRRSWPPADGGEDLNCDGRLDIFDLLALLKLLFS